VLHCRGHVLLLLGSVCRLDEGFLPCGLPCRLSGSELFAARIDAFRLLRAALLNAHRLVLGELLYRLGCEALERGSVLGQVEVASNISPHALLILDLVVLESELARQVTPARCLGLRLATLVLVTALPTILGELEGRRHLAPSSRGRLGAADRSVREHGVRELAGGLLGQSTSRREVVCEARIQGAVLPQPRRNLAVVDVVQRAELLRAFVLARDLLWFATLGSKRAPTFPLLGSIAHAKSDGHCCSCTHGR